MNKELGQTVMTIFYDVDPTEVKNQTGVFGKVFGETCKGKTEEKIDTWRNALEGVATIAGYHLSNWDTEATMIENIATDISNMLNLATRSHDFDDLIGMGAHMERMEPLLRLDLNEVRMIGICGPPGIGKTTIARFQFEQYSNSFQLRAIMVNIKESYRQLGLDEKSAQLKLQSHMLSEMLNQKDIRVPNLGVAQERLKDKEVFLVLDDVDRLEQLDALAKETWWFVPRSRIIITTQDLRVLEAHGINHIYKVDFPSTHEAFQMVCMYAFGQKNPEYDFTELVWEVANIACQLPLGLKVMGSHFKRKSKQEWKNALPSLKNRLHADIVSVLKVSYDALCEDNKTLFLHIACYFNHEELEKVVAYLANCFENVRHRLDVLAEKSLISMENSKIGMHSLLVKLGKDIVHKQFDEPGQRQFFVDSGENCEVLLADEAAGSRGVIGIDCRFNGRKLNISGRAFERMSNLQFLRLKGFYYDAWYLSHGLSYLSPKLRILDWNYFPATRLPSNFNLKFLVELDMSNSNLEKLWEGIKPLANLKWMNLRSSHYLKELPDLSTAKNLQELYLNGCISLVELPSFIGNAIYLKILELSGCSSLVELPFSIGNAINLQDLYLSNCSSLVELPSSIENATNLRKLDLSGCSSLVELPSSLGSAINLQDLYLINCSSLVKLPSSIRNAANHKKLDLSGCSSLVELPSSIGNATNLQILNLSKFHRLVDLPSSIGNATNLQTLNLSGCSSLVELPSSIGNATNLQTFNLRNCLSLVELPSSIGKATNLQTLNLSDCHRLVELPSSIGNATNLQTLNLSDCHRLVELPSSIGNATHLQSLNLSYCTSLVELPSLIGNATSFQKLNLSYCTSLVRLPSSIGNVSNLQTLNLRDCKSLVELPSSIGNLTKLDLDIRGCSSLVELPSTIVNFIMNQDGGNIYSFNTCTSLLQIPSYIGNAIKLESLNFYGCSSLVDVPASIGNLINLDVLIFSECSSLVEVPACIGNLIHLTYLDFNGCSSLVAVPASIGNLHKLRMLAMKGCSKLEILPGNVNLKSLDRLVLSGCSSLKSFPEISTNIRELYLSGTAIEVVPSFIWSCSRLETLDMSYCKNLKEFLHTPDSNTGHDSKRQKVSPFAENCESLERLYSSCHNPYISLNFDNCFKLNQEARDLIIQASTQITVLPGGDIPTYFTYRANYGGSLVVKLKERPFCSSLIFKVCIILVSNDNVEAGNGERVSVHCGIMDKKHRLNILPLTEHLYIFEIESSVTSNEIFFEIVISSDKWAIKECGVHYKRCNTVNDAV